MSFADAEAEARERLTESLALLNHLRLIAPPDFTPLDELQKAQRGLWLVSLYAALEKGVNATVDAALSELSSHGPPSLSCTPPIHSIIHFSKLQSIKDCGYNKIFDSSISLFNASFGKDSVSITDNPLSEHLQNVDGSTIIWVCTLFGTAPYSIDAPSRGRLGTLRERRNAVAHGREAASKVGERYSLQEMGLLYQIVDQELARFRLHLEDYLVQRSYMRGAA